MKVPKRLFLLLTFITVTLILTLPVYAQKIERNEVTLLAKDEVIDQDYFATGEKVTVAGTVNGDAYLAGGNLIIEGDINGDLIAAGGTVNISGKVKQDVRVAGGEVIISGEVGGNVTSIAGSVNLTNSAKIDGSLTSASGNLLVAAPIVKGATIGAGDATISNIIGGNIQAGVGNLTLSPNAHINGNLTYVSDKDANIQDGAIVAGETKHNFPPKHDKEKVQKALSVFVVSAMVISFLATLLLGFILIRFFPIFSAKVVQNIEQKPRSSLTWGLLTVIIAPILIVVMLVTLIGIPLGLILLVSFLIILYISKIFVSILIGRKIFKWMGQKTGDYQALFVGLIFYKLVTFIPIIGAIWAIVIILAGVGAIVISKKELYYQFKNKKLL